MELFLDDNVIIPDEIKNMTPDELDAAIAKLETEHAAEKSKPIEAKQDKKTA